jgi:hypothetical protein
MKKVSQILVALALLVAVNLACFPGNRVFLVRQVGKLGDGAKPVVTAFRHWDPSEQVRRAAEDVLSPATLDSSPRPLGD